MGEEGEKVERRGKKHRRARRRLGVMENSVAMQY
jgi:hypothetical protein